MKTRHAIYLLAAMIAFTGCHKKSKPGTPESGPGTAPAGQGTGQSAAGGGSAGVAGTQLPNHVGNKSAGAGVPAGSGTLSGHVNFSNRGGRHGNLFIYVIDEANFDPVNPNPLASLILTADRITEDSIEFDLGPVPEGNYNVIAVWDVNDPRCDVTASFCAMGDRDVGAQAPPITVKSGSVITDIELNIVPVEY